MKKNQSFEYLENIMENGAFAQKEQIIHFPEYFQLLVHAISKASKGVIME